MSEDIHSVDRALAIEVLDTCASSRMSTWDVLYHLDCEPRVARIVYLVFGQVRLSPDYHLAEIYAEAAQRLREGSAP